jgi:hypothetical protein
MPIARSGAPRAPGPARSVSDPAPAPQRRRVPPPFRARARRPDLPATWPARAFAAARVGPQLTCAQAQSSAQARSSGPAVVGEEAGGMRPPAAGWVGARAQLRLRRSAPRGQLELLEIWGGRGDGAGCVGAMVAAGG